MPPLVNEFSPGTSIGQSTLSGGGVGSGASAGAGSLHKNRPAGPSIGATRDASIFVDTGASIGNEL
jgi:hypothetical protein